jgi:hypothetical protein
MLTWKHHKFRQVACRTIELVGHTSDLEDYMDQSTLDMWHDHTGTSGPMRDYHMEVSHFPNMAKVE